MGVNIVIVAASVFVLCAASGPTPETKERVQPGVGLPLGYRGVDWDMTLDGDDDVYFGSSLLSMADEAQMGPACVSATVSTCPACTQPIPKVLEVLASIGHTPQDACTIFCKEPASPQCTSCRRSLSQECYRCRMVNAESLIKVGCTQIACEHAVASTCPVCTTTVETALDVDCKSCADDDESELCETCRNERAQFREEARKCKQCQQQNALDLLAQGCNKLECAAALGNVCPSCITAGKDECMTCRSEEQSLECAQCYADSATCKRCMTEKVSLLPATCRNAPTNPTPTPSPKSAVSNRVKMFINRAPELMISRSVDGSPLLSADIFDDEGPELVMD